MPVYEVSARSTIVTATANAPLWAFRAIDAQLHKIREIHLFSKTAPTTSGSIGLAKSTALGTGTLTTVVGVPRNPSDAATTSGIVTNWATAVPTIGTVFRRFTSSAAVGNGYMASLELTDPIYLPGSSAATSELVFVNLDATAPGTYDITIVFAI